MNQPANKERLRKLARKWLDGTITPDEAREYAAWYNAEEKAPLIIPPSFALSEEEQEQRILQRMQDIDHSLGRPYRRLLSPLRIAASLLLVAGLGMLGFFLFRNHSTPSADMAAGTPEVRYKNDIEPSNGAITLTLADGSTVLLDTLRNGSVGIDGQPEMVKKDGVLQYGYSRRGVTEKTVSYNTVSTGKGKSFRLLLPDGSAIWLDALSSVRFPTSFPGNERNIEVSGQVYLEVAKDASKPFLVKSGQQTIEVLGTHFNVNAYQLPIKTTLLEGSIRINQAKLQPNQQASFNQDNSLTITSEVDMDEVISWKTGQFRFNGTSLPEIMDQLERWYDIEIVYQDKMPPMQLVAKIKRDIPIQKILKLLELTGQVSFAVEGNRVTVINPQR